MRDQVQDGQVVVTKLSGVIRHELTMTNSLFLGRRRDKMNRTDVALLGSLWWPYAPYDELCIANHLASWVRD